MTTLRCNCDAISLLNLSVMLPPAPRSVSAPSASATAVPTALPIGAALAQSAPLVSLRERLRESEARFDAVRALLPPALVAHVRPGPVDETGWSLLAANSAVAAKLRQLQPWLEAALARQGVAVPMVRIKVCAG